MYPMYKGYHTDLQLHSDDIRGVQVILNKVMIYCYKCTNLKKKLCRKYMEDEVGFLLNQVLHQQRQQQGEFHQWGQRQRDFQQ